MVFRALILYLILVFLLQSSIDLIRTFIESSPGNFKYIDINEENTAEQEINITNTTNIMNYRKIKPTEYKTFLKIKKCVDSRKVSDKNFIIYHFSYLTDFLGKVIKQWRTIYSRMDSECIAKK